MTNNSFYFILFSYPTTLYSDKNNYISVGTKCFKSKACTQQTMTWLILNSQTQKHKTKKTKAKKERNKNSYKIINNNNTK
jgi:hypothetical protein